MSDNLKERVNESNIASQLDQNYNLSGTFDKKAINTIYDISVLSIGNNNFKIEIISDISSIFWVTSELKLKNTHELKISLENKTLLVFDAVLIGFLTSEDLGKSKIKLIFNTIRLEKK